MKIPCLYALICLSLSLQFCSVPKASTRSVSEPTAANIKSRVVIKNKVAPRKINTRNISADAIVSLAESLEAVPYVYGGSSKEKGFDCSGLIWYVFKQYKIDVPRTSVDFTNAGVEIPLTQSRRGDIILFTGSDANSGVVGHMGMITKNDKGMIQFINAIQGDGNGVTYSKLSGYFVPRFVKVIRVFNNK